ncbi:Uncharacterised protein [uncultured archaeon]|nr:Uncharacterised protein [uncultured archaeon]
MKKTLRSLVLGAILGATSLASAGTDFSYSPITNNASLVPTEQTEYLVQAASSNALMGTVSGATNDWLVSGTATNVVANPNTANHYRFVNWTTNGVEAGTNLTYAFNVNSPLTNLVANFDIERFNVDIQNGVKYGLNPTNFTNIAYGSSVTSTAANLYYTNSPGVRTKITGLQKQ